MEEWQEALEGLGGGASVAAEPRQDWQKDLARLGGQGEDWQEALDSMGQAQPAAQAAAKPEPEEGGKEDMPWYKAYPSTAWDFVKDLGEAATIDIWRGTKDLTRQQRLLFNYVQGDSDEIDRLIESGRADASESQGRTVVGRWAKQAGSSAPYLIENIGARVAGGATGSVAGPGGTTVGQTLGGMAVGYSQGWGELFERLVNEGVDKDEAAKISFVLAAPYAGIEALQVGPILNRMGLGKYAAGAFSKKIGDLIAKNPVLRSKVARALGDRAKGVLGESVEEGLQGGVMNAGEQWARGTWSTAEFFQAIKDDTVESVGPMGITLGVASGIGKYRQWRANKHLGKNQKEEFENEARFQPFVKRAWAKETGTPIGVSSEMPQGEKERVVWATKFTKQDREEIFNKAGEMAQRDLDGYKAENPGASAEDLKAFFDAALAHHARELAVFAHNFKLRVCDLDLDSYAFDRVFAPKKAAAAQAERPEGQPGESAGEGAPGAQNMSETQPGGEQNLPDAGQDNDEKKSRISLEGDTRSEAELDALNAKHRELYERYKNGDQSAYEEAAKLVAEEGGRKGYEVKVYHGTGADGFDVADATSKHQDNGEGAQAHGRGVYMAVSRDTAEGYRNRSNPINVVRLGDKAIDYQKMGFASLDELIDEVYDLRDNYNLKSNPKGILDSLLSSLPYWEKQAREAREKIAQGDTAYEYNLKEAEEQINYINADAKKLQKWIGVFGEGQTLSDLNVHRGFGRVFDWFHNMKPGEVIDQDKPISEQPDILEKFKKAYEEDILPLLKEAFGFDEDEFERAKAKLNTNRVAGRVISSAGLLIGGDKFAQILLKHGIRGTKYVGRRDGEVYTSFEGGSTVKLQDPFTFDDNGELIPLAERFDSANPSMRYRFGKKWSRQAVGGFDFSGPVDPRGEAEYKKYKEQIGKPNEKLKIKPVMHPNLQLPRSVRDKKIGIASPSGIRRWVLAALDIPFMGEVSSVQKRSGLAGAYYLKRDSLHLNSEQIAELDTLFHEIGHALDLRIFNGKAASVPKKIRAELVDWIVKNGKARGLAVEAYSAAELPGEGWAEFMADFMLDPASAKKNLPLTFAFFSAALNDNKPLKKIMTQARKMIAGYVEAPEAKRAKVHVVADSDLNAFKEPLSKRIYGAYEAIGKSFADLFGSLSDLQDYVNAVAGEGAADFDARRKNFMGGALGQSELSLKHGQVDLDGKFVGDSLAGILAPVWDRADDFRTFIIARRALNLLKSDKTMPRGAPREALDAYCFKNFGLSYYVLKNAYDSASFAFRAASAKLDAFNNNNLRLLVDGGIISREFAAKMEKNLGYVPFRRLLELESPNVSQSSASDSSPIHARRGSAREIIDPLQTIMENAVIFREIAQKNLIKMGLVDSVSKLSGYGKILEQDIERLKATAVDRESVARAIVEARLASEVLGVDTADMSKQEQVELVAQKISESNPLFQFFMWARDVRANPSKQVITVLRGGKREAWKIRDKGVYDALMALDGGAAKIFNVFADATTNVIDKFLRGSGSLMKFTATNNIRFSISNFVRDQLTAAVFTSSEQGFIPFISTFTKGLWASITHNADYREWVANGGYNSNFVGETGKMSLEDVVGAKSSAPRRVAGHVRREAGEGAWRGVKALVNVAVEPLRRTAETLESATRIAEHKLNKEDYVSRFGLEAWRNDAAARRRAANASKSVTINFAEGGSFAKFMNRYVPFFNAWAQGLRKTFIEALPVNIPLALKYIAGDRSFGASKVYNDNGAAKLVKMLANTAILMMLKAALAPDDEDDIPEWQRETCWTFQDGEGNIIAIPKDYEALPIYEAFERAFGADRKSGFWNFMLVQILAPNLMPPAVKAVVEHSANKSFFRDAPIVSRGIENLPTRYKYYPTTSQTLRALSSGLEDVFGEYAPSPVILDHYVNAFTTGLGREALWWLDRAGEVVGGRQKSVNSSFDFSPSNPLSKFRTNPFAASGSLEIFYEARNEAQGFFALENKLKSGEIKNGLKPYEIRRLEWYSARKRDIGQVSKAIESYNRQIRAALGDESLDGAEKQRMVKMFVKMRNDLAKRAKDLKYSDAAYGAWRKEVEKDAVLRGF